MPSMVWEKLAFLASLRELVAPKTEGEGEEAEEEKPIKVLYYNAFH